jgi:hypothetical protein
MRDWQKRESQKDGPKFSVFASDGRLWAAMSDQVGCGLVDDLELRLKRVGKG